MDDARADGPPRKLAALLGTIFLLAECAGLLLASRLIPRITAVFSEFEAPLPALTKFVLTNSFSAMCLALTIGAVFLAILGRGRLRTGALVVAALLPLVHVAGLVVGLWLPLLDIVETVVGAS